MTPTTRPLLWRLVAAVGGGAALVAAFPPLDQRWVPIVALPALFLALRGARGRSGALVGFVFGFGFFGILLYWISYFGYAAWIVLVVAQAAFTAIFGFFGARASSSLPGRLIGIPLLWTGVEMARSRYPLGGFSWGALGASQHGGGTLLPVARVGGMFGVTLVLALIAAVLAEIVAVRRHRVSLALGAAALYLLPGVLPLPTIRVPATHDPRAYLMDVAAVQGNVPRERFTGLGRQGRVGPEDFTIVDDHIRVTQQLIGTVPPDLIVWAENSFDRDPRTNPEMFDPVRATLTQIGSPLLAGAILDAGDRFTNSNILFSQSGEILQRYDKIHLVPFGEYVPWRWARSVVPALDRELPSDAIPGRHLVVFDVGGHRVGSLICFESTYPELARDLARNGAQIIVVTTNDASFGTSPAARAHLAMTQMRAVETGRVVVQTAIAGISAFIEPNGHIFKESHLFRPAILRGLLPLASGETPYDRYGSAIEIAIGALALLFAMGPFVRGGGEGR